MNRKKYFRGGGYSYNGTKGALVFNEIIANDVQCADHINGWWALFA